MGEGVKCTVFNDIIISHKSKIGLPDEIITKIAKTEEIIKTLLEGLSLKRDSIGEENGIEKTVTIDGMEIKGIAFLGGEHNLLFTIKEMKVSVNKITDIAS